MEITFRVKTGYENLDNLNSLLYKNSKGRFELKRTKNCKKWYMLDYDEIGKDRVVKNYKEIFDILNCMHISIIDIDKAYKINWKEV